jgi:hypothetical protein
MFKLLLVLFLAGCASNSVEELTPEREYQLKNMAQIITECDTINGCSIEKIDSEKRILHIEQAMSKCVLGPMFLCEAMIIDEKLAINIQNNFGSTLEIETTMSTQDCTIERGSFSGSVKNGDRFIGSYDWNNKGISLFSCSEPVKGEFQAEILLSYNQEGKIPHRIQGTFFSGTLEQTFEYYKYELEQLESKKK